MYRPKLGAPSLYQSGSRFSLGGWSAEEWNQFFTGASQLYGTVTHQPVAAPPAPIVQTPIGSVPTWAILGIGLVGAAVLLRPGRR